MITPSSGGLEISHWPLAYDFETAAARIREQDLPDDYADALVSGLWPNMDVLPPEERRRRGRPIDPWTAHWMPSPATAAE